MKIQNIKKGALEYALITDVYSEDEVTKLKHEIEQIQSSASVGITEPALDEENKPLNYANTLWVDNIFADRSQSNILTLNRMLFAPEIVGHLSEISIHYGHLKNCSFDCTLVNYYGNEDEYKPHYDGNIFTALTFFKFADFTGGELEFVDFGEVIKPIENTMVIFPGCVKHHAHKVVTESDSYCRVSMAQFLNYRLTGM